MLAAGLAGMGLLRREPLVAQSVPAQGKSSAPVPAGSSASDSAQGQASAPAPAGRPAIDPELLREEAGRAAWTPQVAPDLQLPELGSVLALDSFDGQPELVPLVQSAGDLSRTTSHNVLPLRLNPRSAPHPVVRLKGAQAAVQLHLAQPAIYLRIGDDSGVWRGGTPLVVDTQGMGGMKQDASGGSPDSGYVVVRADERADERLLDSFNIALLGVKQQQGVIETTSELLPGGHWMKVTPVRPLDPGEYALIEVVSDNRINEAVWDFGVHPSAPENADAIRPQPKRPITLHRR